MFPLNLRNKHTQIKINSQFLNKIALHLQIIFYW